MFRLFHAEGIIDTKFQHNKCLEYSMQKAWVDNKINVAEMIGCGLLNV